MASKRKLLTILVVIIMLVPFVLLVLSRVLSYQRYISFPMPVDEKEFISRQQLKNMTPGTLDDALVISFWTKFLPDSTNVLWKLIDKFPDEPALYACVLKHATKEGPLTNIERPNIYLAPHPLSATAKAWKPLPYSADVRRVEKAIAIGKKLEPDNAYFDLVEADLRFEQGRDSEALAAIHRAAGQTDFNSHEKEVILAVFRYRREHTPAIMYWLNPVEKNHMIRSDGYYTVAIRRTALLAAWHAKQNAKYGRVDRALAITYDLVKLGGMMYDKNDSPFDATSGWIVQRVGVNGTYFGITPVTFSTKPNERRLPETEVIAERLSAVQSAAAKKLTEDQWKSLRDELHSGGEFYRRFRKSNPSLFTRPIFISWAPILVGGVLLLQALWFAFFWLVARIWLRRRSYSGAENLGPNRLSVWLLAILPSVAILVTASITMTLDPVSYTHLTLPTTPYV